MTESTPKRRKMTGVVLGVVALALCLFAAVRGRHALQGGGSNGRQGSASSSSSGNHPPPPVAASPAELAVVAPLAVDSPLGAGWKVTAIFGVRDGQMRVSCLGADGKSRIDLDIAIQDEGGPSPPAVAGKYAIYYSARKVPPEDAERLSKALAEVIEKNQAVAPPPGMTPFRPKPKPPEPL